MRDLTSTLWVSYREIDSPPEVGVGAGQGFEVVGAVVAVHGAPFCGCLLWFWALSSLRQERPLWVSGI